MLGLKAAFEFGVGSPHNFAAQPKNCAYCTHYTCLHILSILSLQQRISPRTDVRFHEVGIWSPVLEPVKGQTNVFRRIGAAKKNVPISELDHLDRSTTGGEKEPLVPVLFDTWRLRTVTII